MLGSNRKVALALTAVIMVVLPLSVETLFGCAPKTSETGHTSTPEPLSINIEWSMNSECSVCHITEKESEESPGTLTFAHSGEKLECADCHTDFERLGRSHERVEADSKKPSKLKRTKVTNETCMTCHDQNELAQVTAGSTLLTDKHGTTINPHMLPENETHLDVLCSSCHSMHSEDDVDQRATNTCLNCHHDNVYECYTCH